MTAELQKTLKLRLDYGRERIETSPFQKYLDELAKQEKDLTEKRNP